MSGIIKCLRSFTLLIQHTWVGFCPQRAAIPMGENSGLSAPLPHPHLAIWRSSAPWSIRDMKRSFGLDILGISGSVTWQLCHQGIARNCQREVGLCAWDGPGVILAQPLLPPAPRAPHQRRNLQIKIPFSGAPQWLMDSLHLAPQNPGWASTHRVGPVIALLAAYRPGTGELGQEVTFSLVGVSSTVTEGD